MRLEPIGIEVDFSENRLVLPMGVSATVLKKGDRRPFLAATLFNPDGTPLNLTALSVTFTMRNAVTRALVTNSPATITSALEGRVSYAWSAADTATPGEFEAHFVVDHGGGVLESFPNRDAHPVRIEP